MRLALSLVLLFAAQATLAAPAPETPVTHAEFDGLIEQYLKKHPEVVVDAFAAAQIKHEEEQQKKNAELISSSKDTLTQGTDTPVAGDVTHAQATVIEFFDYDCGYCKRMFPVVAPLARDKASGVKIVFKEFPIFGPESDELATIALAVHRLAPEQYFPFHSAMMTLKSHGDIATVDAILTKLGLDPAKVRKEAQDPGIKASIEQNHALGGKLGIQGTPAFLIGDELIPGALSKDDFLAKIAAQKQKASAK